jgi:hypothetical protein
VTAALAKAWKKRALVHSWWPCGLVQSLGKTVQKFIRSKTEPPDAPATSFLGRCAKEMKTVRRRDSCQNTEPTSVSICG